REMRTKLVGLNENLERRVVERTAALQQEIAERKKAEAQREALIEDLTNARDALHYQATHDELTQQWNRSTVLRALEKELSRTSRQNTPLGVMIMDIDHFKQVNDNFGHLAGDAVLRAVTKRIGSVVRPYDTVGRYGGEEFIIVLPGCNRARARQVAERLRSSFSRFPVKTKEGVFNITMSFGVTTVEGGKKRDMDSVIREADTALYRAKNGGRNRVVLWGDAVAEVVPRRTTRGRA
ncbi:GGDEF domain-containing protein, partial [Thermodesulfobacteriota bacterium]